MSAAILDPPHSLDGVALADMLRPALLRVSRRLRHEGLRSGLSAQDSVLLGHVRSHPGIGVSGLADLEQTSRPTMSAHLKRLEGAGLIERDENLADGRRCGFTLSDAGLNKIEQIRVQRNDWLAGQLAKLESAERDQLEAAAAPLLKLAVVAS